jgi:Kdo2-lipid IVA lauroyltransferase/acyltransferase
MNALLYYGVVKPFSLLPLPILYLFSDLLNLFLFKIFNYRKAVIYSNIEGSFPEKSKKEIAAIAHEFHRHFCDLIIESIKGFSISENEVRKRVKFENPELANQFYEQNKSIIITGGHYGNWEWYALAAPLYHKHHIAGIYKPLKNKYFDDKIKETRGRFGLELISMKSVKNYYEINQDKPFACVFATDQSPSSVKNCFWIDFLNRETAVLTGSERFAKEYNHPVIYGDIVKIKRGYYKLVYQLVAENPSQTEEIEITKIHTRMLEEMIKKQPEYWLWSHKRWKRKRENQ